MGQVQRELERLSSAGILRRFERGRHVYFQANRSSPFFEELRGLVEKTVVGLDVLSQALKKLADRIDATFVFGSFARGEGRPESDLDLLVVGEVSLQDVVAAVAPLEETLGREISPIVYPLAELRSKLANGDHFLTTVFADEKIFVIGTQHELGELLA